MINCLKAILSSFYQHISSDLKINLLDSPVNPLIFVFIIM